MHYFDMEHKAHDPYQDQPYYSHWASAFFSLIVFVGTAQLAFFLKKIKFSPFMPNQMFRNSITDFAVVISILVWSLIGNSFDAVPIEKLNVPSVFAPTFQCCKLLTRASSTLRHSPSQPLHINLHTTYVADVNNRRFVL